MAEGRLRKVIEHWKLEEIHPRMGERAIHHDSDTRQFIAVDQSRTSSSTSLHILSSWLVDTPARDVPCLDLAGREVRVECSGGVDGPGWTGLQEDCNYGQKK